jgi:hypothetical protein
MLITVGCYGKEEQGGAEVALTSLTLFRDPLGFEAEPLGASAYWWRVSRHDKGIGRGAENAQFEWNLPRIVYYIIPTVVLRS